MCIRFIHIGPRFGQIVPVWIHRFDQVKFLASTPSLNFLFAIDGGVGIDEAFVIDEAREVVATGEAGDEFVFVFEDATAQVTGNAGIEDMGTRPIGHDVDVESSGLGHGRVLTECVIPRLGAFQPSERSGADPTSFVALGAFVRL